jgi:hypothetical protein
MPMPGTDPGCSSRVTPISRSALTRGQPVPWAGNRLYYYRDREGQVIYSPAANALFRAIYRVLAPGSTVWRFGGSS